MVDRLLGQQRNAVPEHAAIVLTQQQRALTDRESGLDPDSGDAEIVAPDQPVTCRQLLAREP